MREPEQLTAKEYIQTVFVMFGHGSFPKKENVTFTLVFFFNKDAYYHLGDYEAERNLRMMIVRAWYSALGLELDDYPGLVHYPENCRYILDVNDFNFEGEYNKLLNRFDYLAKLDTKAYEMATVASAAVAGNLFFTAMAFLMDGKARPYISRRW
ncbi:Protein of uncharacterised function (DUF3296) [Kluyvera cryocrescens]|uniref:Protein of uncharacterized function (DUF3296) n=1 Tax=Kluyvera cryocrescens TaxID=580 RepID=A0A485D3X3_KLUCR|nr:Protein of uncharacterised function (DUF3296) [Kluyvera cryocrescens]